MGNGAQKLLCVPFFLQGISRVSRSDQLDFGRPQFPFLPCCGRSYEFALYCCRCPGGELADVIKSGCALLCDNLQIGEARAIIEFEKRKTFGITAGSDPALDLEVVHGIGCSKDMLN